MGDVLRPDDPWDVGVPPTWLGKDFGCLNIAKWAGMETPEREWILPGFIPCGLMTFLTGKGMVGKSLLTQQLCTAVATGVPFLGHEMEKRPALYITAEDDRQELHKRQKSICATLGVSLEQAAKNLALRTVVDFTEEVALSRYAQEVEDDFGGKPAGMKPTALFREISRQIEEEGHGLLVLDNVSHFFNGNENDRHEVASFIRLVSGLAVRRQCAVVLIGFPNKAGTDSGDGRDGKVGAQFSGSSAWENQVRSRIFMYHPDPDGDPDRLRLTNPKANYAGSGEITFRWHNLSYVLETDLPQDMREASRASAMAAQDNGIFLKCLDLLEQQGRRVTPNQASGYAPKVMEAMTPAKQHRVSKERLKEAMERLLLIGEIEFVVVGKSRSGNDEKGLRRVQK